LTKIIKDIKLDLAKIEMQSSVMSNPASTTDPAHQSHDPNNAMIQLASASEQYANASHNHMHNASSFVDADAAFAGGSAYATNAPNLHGAPPQPHDNSVPVSASTPNGQVQIQGQAPVQAHGMTNFNVNHASTTAASLPMSSPATSSASSVIRDFVIPYPSPPSENLTNKKKRKSAGGAKSHQVSLYNSFHGGSTYFP
jgi:hypothetical protein